VLNERIKSEVWKKMYSEELQNFNSSPDIFRVVKKRQISWARHVAHMVKIKHVLLSKIFQDPHSKFSDQNFLNAQETFIQSVKTGCGAGQPPIQ